MTEVDDDNAEQLTCSDCGKPEHDSDHDDENPDGHFFNIGDPVLGSAEERTARADTLRKSGRKPFVLASSRRPASHLTPATTDECIACGLAKSEGQHRGRGSHTFATVFSDHARSHAGISEAIERAVASIRICRTKLRGIKIRPRYDNAGDIEVAMASIKVTFVFAKGGEGR